MHGRTCLPADVPARLVRSADFERVLAAPQRARSPHFALHFLAARPSRPGQALVQELSTGDAPIGPKAVDDLPDRRWLGTVVPKRHARRAVTRNLIKRQMREVVRAHASTLDCGLWVLRLRAPFGVDRFPSAASGALKQAARAELEQVLARAGA